MLLSVASALVGLVLAEIGARAAYRAPWFEQLAAQQQANAELEYERNSYNLRGPDYTYPKSADKRRILMIGDSFTFGMGVARDADIFARRCEAALNKKPELPAVELVNGSIIGSLTSHWMQVWDGLKDRFDPDLLVFVFFLRDGTLAGSVPEFFDVIRDEVSQRNRDSWAYRNLALFRFWRDEQDRERIRTHYTGLFREAYFGDQQATAEWRNAQRNLTRMITEARARGTRVGFVIFPVLAGLDEESYAFQDICDLLEEFALGQQLDTLNLLQAFRGRKGPELWISPFDQHPNESAHRIAAEALTPFLERLLREHTGG